MQQPNRRLVRFFQSGDHHQSRRFEQFLCHLIGSNMFDMDQTPLGFVGTGAGGHQVPQRIRFTNLVLFQIFLITVLINENDGK